MGDTLCPGFNHPYYWSDRVYETMGRGGFIIHPWIKGLQDEFIDGVHLRYYEYDNFKELKRLIDYYLKHDTERERIRRAGHEQVRNGCTYKARLTEALRVVEAVRKLKQPVSLTRQPVYPTSVLDNGLAPDDGWVPPVLQRWGV